jgi:integrase
MRMKYQPFSGTRKAHVLQVLNPILNEAIRRGYLHVHPMKTLRTKERPKRSRRVMLFLDANQVDALAEAVTPRYGTLVYTLAYGGFRAGEVAALRVSDLDWDESPFLVDESISDVSGALVSGKPKTDESKRVVSMPTFVMGMLREEVGDRRANPDAFVFPGRTASRTA